MLFIYFWHCMSYKYNWRPFYYIQNINVGANEIGLELMLGYYVSIDSLDERNTGVDL